MVRNKWLCWALGKVWKSWRFWWCQKGICLTKEENVNHAYLEDVEKKSLDYHHQKGGECECMNTWILMMPKKNQTKSLQRIRICFKINSRLLQQTKPYFKIH